MINGWVGEENSFVGNIRLTLLGAAQGSSAVRPSLLFSDLKQQGGTETVGRQQFAITGDQTLTPEVPSTYQVKVTGVKVPGEYRGKVELLVPGRPRAEAEVVDVVLLAKARPALTPLSEAERVQASLVRCAAGCWLARLLLPAGHFQHRLELRFEKPLSAPLGIDDVTFAVRGDQTRYSLKGEQFRVALDELSALRPPAGAVGADAPGTPQSGQGAADSSAAGSALTLADQKLADQKYVTLPVVLNPGDLPADHYTGNIYLTLAGQSSAVKVPVDLSVRAGPLWPLLILFVSIILGRLFKYMQDKGNAKADALEAINRLEYRAREAHPDDAAIISPMLEEARDMVYQDRAAEVAATVNAAASRLVTLNELRQIEARLAGKEELSAVQEIVRHIGQCRERIRQRQDAQAKALLDKIKDALVTMLTTLPVTDGAPDTDIADAVRRAESAADATGSALRTAGPRARQRLRGWLIDLSGLSDEFRAEATLWVVRPLLWFVLLLGLVALGMKTLYVDNPVFGASLFADILSLIFWGLSADVASRTLSNLRVTNAGRAAAG